MILTILLVLASILSSSSASVIWYPPLLQPVKLGKVQSWGLLEEDVTNFRADAGKSLLSAILKQDQDSEEANEDIIVVKTEDDNIDKRNVFGAGDPVFYEDYEYEEDEPVWTKVGNGRVKILPLTFGNNLSFGVNPYQPPF